MRDLHLGPPKSGEAASTTSECPEGAGALLSTSRGLSPSGLWFWQLPAMMVVGCVFGDFICAVHDMTIGANSGLVGPDVVLPVLGVAVGGALVALWRLVRTASESGATAVRLGVLTSIWGMVGGSMGYGPLYLLSVMTDATLGPPIAAFVTGPVGVLAGCVVGIAIWAIRRRSSSV